MSRRITLRQRTKHRDLIIVHRRGVGGLEDDAPHAPIVPVALTQAVSNKPYRIAAVALYDIRGIIPASLELLAERRRDHPPVQGQ